MGWEGRLGASSDLFRQDSELRLRGQRGTEGLESFERAARTKRERAVSLRRQLSPREPWAGQH